MENSAIFILDGSDIIVVDNEKYLLVREVIKHYTERWQTEAKESDGKRQKFNIGEAVSKMLTRLSVKHELNPEGVMVQPMSIIVPAEETAPANDGANDWRGQTAPTSSGTTTTTTPPSQSSGSSFSASGSAQSTIFGQASEDDT